MSRRWLHVVGRYLICKRNRNPTSRGYSLGIGMNFLVFFYAFRFKPRQKPPRKISKVKHGFRHETTVYNFLTCSWKPLVLQPQQLQNTSVAQNESHLFWHHSGENVSDCLLRFAEKVNGMTIDARACTQQARNGFMGFHSIKLIAGSQLICNKATVYARQEGYSSRR